MYEPSDDEVRDAMESIRSTDPALGIVKMTEKIKSANPTWALGLKRTRAIKKSAGLSVKILGAPNPQTPSTPVSIPDISPMAILMQVLGRLVVGGDWDSSKRVAQTQVILKYGLLSESVMEPTLIPGVMPDDHYPFVQRDVSWSAENFPMKSCKLVSSIVMQFSAPNDLLAGCLVWNSRAWPGRPTSDLIHKTPSTPLSPSYEDAKKLAMEKGQSTVIAGNIVDVEMMDRGAGRVAGSLDHMSFAHSFVLIVGPEGVRVIQAWGKHGYSLGDNIASDGSRLRNWKEAKEFVSDYDKLCGLKGKWARMPAINQLYKKCFGVDVLHITSPKGPEDRTVVPIFRAWSRVKVLSDVKSQDITRWLKIIDAVDEFLGLTQGKQQCVADAL